MKYKKCHLILIFGIFLLIANPSIFTESSNQSSPKTARIIYDPPIHIDSDSDFVSMGLDGSGNSISPYIISDYVIDVSGFLNNGILIEDTTKYFIIQNCTIYTDYIGIRIDNVGSGTALIRNNTCISKSYDGGGLAASGNNVQFVNNTCINFAQGIHTNQAINMKIINNTIRNSTYQGINIRYTSNSIIRGNLIMDSTQYAIVIVISSSNNNHIYSNTIIGELYLENANIDGSNADIPTSQAYDGGSSNFWFNETSQIGNYWSDCRGSRYKIDGSADSIDKFPLNCGPIIPGYIGIGVISLVIVFLSVIGYFITNRKAQIRS